MLKRGCGVVEAEQAAAQTAAFRCRPMKNGDAEEEFCRTFPPAQLRRLSVEQMEDDCGFLMNPPPGEDTPS